ncbi:MAG: sulfotransferase [Caulobacteraceae bacterium]|nr:sulfotransferase [Caulobacteraceae bacterium]
MTKRLIFIAGVEGSGTTALLRILSAPPACASLGGNFLRLPEHPDARRLAKAFGAANQAQWDRTNDLAAQMTAPPAAAACLREIAQSAAFEAATHLLLKRSSPFGKPRDRFTPDLWDVLDLTEDARIVICYRDPRAAAYSALRRFGGDLRQVALATADHLTFLAAQAQAIGAGRVHVLSYRTLCDRPEAALAPLAHFCELPLGALCEAERAARPQPPADDGRYRTELAREECRWLDAFFDDRRRAQWPLFEAAAAPLP